MPPKKKTDSGPTDLMGTLSKLRSGKNGKQIGALDDFDMTVNALTTGNITLDALTGVGGIPRGRVTEFRGKPSSGKTTAALQAAARLQQAGGNFMFLDYERSIDPKYVRALGIDTRADSFIYYKPVSFEDGANVYRELLKTGDLDMAIFDSVATMVTENELNADTGKATMADRAKMMHQFLRQTVGMLEQTDSALVLLNHLMDLVDTSPMGQRMAQQGIKRKTSPGGTSVPFYASLRVEFNQSGNIRTAEMDTLSQESVNQIRQTKVQATVIKNKVGDPFRTAEVRVRYGKGFSQAFSVLQVLVAHGVIAKTQAGKHTFADETAPEIGGQESFASEEKTIAAMESDAEWLARLERIAQEALDAAEAAAWDTISPEEIEALKAEETEIDREAKQEDSGESKASRRGERDADIDALLEDA